MRFNPILVERIWGGNTLADYGKAVPPGKRIGESWEISDRDDAQSVVANGEFKGQTLHQLIVKLGKDLLGSNCQGLHRFPLLVKMLDAREKLSLQVHPPATLAALLGGEPKTEMWYVLDADPGAQLIAGLRHGVTRQQFEQAIQKGGAAFHECFHSFTVGAGESLFVPSGRLHAIGAGLVIVEIQQNSDTTYRAYDWDRVGTDGKPRALHVRESLASIDFNDFEPSPTPLPIHCPHFHVEKLPLKAKREDRCDGSSFQIIVCIEGEVAITSGSHVERLTVGEFALLPAALGAYTLAPAGQTAAVLKSTVPSAV